jgi:hypothetical protein
VDGTVDAGADTVSFLTPVYVMYLTPVVDTSKTYQFQLIYASGDTAAFSFDAGAVGTEPIDTFLIDSLMDSLTGIAGIADSVTAHDSVTYIKLIAKYATETHGGRWRVQSNPRGDPRMSPRDDGVLLQTYSASNATVAMICDTLVAKHNALTTTKDSVLATDFGTYFTLSTKVGNQDNTDNLPGGWSVTCWGEDATGENADSAFDTATTTAATIPSVINGIVAAINATVTVKDTVEASSDGDTAINVIARRYKKFTMTVDDRFIMDDTIDDAASFSTTTDSFPIAKLTTATTLQGRLIVSDLFFAAIAGNIGYTESKLTGLADTAIVWMKTSGPIGSWVIDSQICASLPCTLDVTIGDQDGDSLLSEVLWFKWYVGDSISDTNGVTVAVPIEYDILLK